MSQSSQFRQWITIDEVVNLYLDQSEQSSHKFFKCWHLAFSGMEKLGLDFFYQIKSVKLPVNANKTVTLPGDYLNYTKLGPLNSNGEVVPLKYNDKLTLFRDNNPNRLTDVEGNVGFINFYLPSSPIFFNFWDGMSYGNLYGLPGGAPYMGGFKIDNANGVILLDTLYTWDNLVLEYMASPQEGQAYYIPIQFKEALKWWIAWNDISMMPISRKGNLGTIAQRRHEYFEARRLGWAEYKPFYLDQAYIASQENMRLVIKG